MARDPEPAPVHVLVSRPAAAPSGTEALGRTHYSYGFAARNFSRMLGERGHTVTAIVRPEQFKGVEYARTLGLDGPGRPHLIFRSTEDIRPIPGAYNIACFAWEFEVLSHGGLVHQPVLGDQVAMLRTCDEIWAPCGFTQRVLEAHGFDNVRFFPSPVFPPDPARDRDRARCWATMAEVASVPLVSSSSNFVTGYEADAESDAERLEAEYARPLTEQPALQRVIEGGGRVFTTVLNPYDKRKNLANMLDGFLMATADRDDAVLVVKLITSGIVEPPAGYLHHQIRLLLGRPHCVHEERVVLMGGYLTFEQMTAMYDGSDFYLCASIAEGQNAPLLEAMAHGCTPVSTANTAMGDYIDAENAVIISERRFPGLIPGLAADVAGRAYAVDFCDRYAIAEAVRTALALDDAELAAKAEAARAAVARRFAVDAVYPGLNARLREIQAGLGKAP